jgi:hypothetical protein
MEETGYHSPILSVGAIALVYVFYLHTIQIFLLSFFNVTCQADPPSPMKSLQAYHKEIT